MTLRCHSRRRNTLVAIGLRADISLLGHGKGWSLLTQLGHRAVGGACNAICITDLRERQNKASCVQAKQPAVASITACTQAASASRNALSLLFIIGRSRGWRRDRRTHRGRRRFVTQITSSGSNLLTRSAWLCTSGNLGRLRRQDRRQLLCRRGLFRVAVASLSVRV